MHIIYSCRGVEQGRGTTAVTATASTAEAALELLKEYTVDVVLLDLEMPGMGGLKALPQLLDANGDMQVLVVSSLTEKGADHTLRALAMGAADTMLKPRPGGFDEAYRITLVQKIQALGSQSQPTVQSQPAATSRSQPAYSHQDTLANKRPEIVAFGASTGGIHALTIILKALPSSFTHFMAEKSITSRNSSILKIDHMHSSQPIHRRSRKTPSFCCGLHRRPIPRDGQGS